MALRVFPGSYNSCAKYNVFSTILTRIFPLFPKNMWMHRPSVKQNGEEVQQIDPMIVEYVIKQNRIKVLLQGVRLIKIHIPDDRGISR